MRGKNENGVDGRTLKFFKVTVKGKFDPWGPAKLKEPYLEKFNAY